MCASGQAERDFALQPTCSQTAASQMAVEYAPIHAVQQYPALVCAVLCCAVAQSLAVLPFALVSVLVFSGTVYGMAGLRHDAAAFFTHLAVATLAYLIASQVHACMHGP